MKTVLFLLVSLLSFHTFDIHSFTIDRVILASDDGPMYLDFWPIVSKAWSERIGIRATLILVSDNKDLVIDETYGDVIRVNTIPGVPIALHTQTIRLLAPAYFPDEVCIISDIDMMPLKKSYFVDSVKDIADDQFVVYRDLGYGENSLRFPMCYNAGKGYLWKEIFGIKSAEEISAIIQRWHALNWGWETDEVVLYKSVRKWDRFDTNCTFLGDTSMVPQRIDRVNWKYSLRRLKKDYYIDAHMVRPFSQYKREIMQLVDDLEL